LPRPRRQAVPAAPPARRARSGRIAGNPCASCAIVSRRLSAGTLTRRGRRSMDGGERRRGLARAAAVLALALAGCGADRPTREGGPIAPEAFVETYVELRRAARQIGDSAAWEARKREILDARGLTEEALEAFVESRGGDV